VIFFYGKDDFVRRFLLLPLLTAFLLACLGGCPQGALPEAKQAVKDNKAEPPPPVPKGKGKGGRPQDAGTPP